MNCPYSGFYCYMQNCADCSCVNYWNHVYPQPKQEYKYKCTCGGEFLEAVYKWVVPPVDGDNTGVTGTSGYFCPFCGKEMVGLN